MMAMLAVDILCLLPNHRCSNSVMGSSTDIFCLLLAISYLNKHSPSLYRPNNINSIFPTFDQYHGQQRQSEVKGMDRLI